MREIQPSEIAFSLGKSRHQMRLGPVCSRVFLFYWFTRYYFGRTPLSGPGRMLVDSWPLPDRYFSNNTKSRYPRSTYGVAASL